MSYTEAAARYIAVKQDLLSALALDLNGRQKGWLKAGARQNMRGISQRLTKDLKVANRPKYRVEGIQGNEPNLDAGGMDAGVLAQ
jgi:hypothetical protein